MIHMVSPIPLRFVSLAPPLCRLCLDHARTSGVSAPKRPDVPAAMGFGFMLLLCGTNMFTTDYTDHTVSVIIYYILLLY